MPGVCWPLSLLTGCAVGYSQTGESATELAKVEERFPSGEDKRQQFLHQVGQDGWGLLSAILADPQSHWMLSIAAMETDASDWETRRLAAGPGRNLDSRGEPAGGGQSVLFALRPGCLSRQETIKLLDWLQSAFHPKRVMKTNHASGPMSLPTWVPLQREKLFPLCMGP